MSEGQKKKNIVGAFLAAAGNVCQKTMSSIGQTVKYVTTPKEFFCIATDSELENKTPPSAEVWTLGGKVLAVASYRIVKPMARMAGMKGFAMAFILNQIAHRRPVDVAVGVALYGCFSAIQAARTLEYEPGSPVPYTADNFKKRVAYFAARPFC